MSNGKDPSPKVVSRETLAESRFLRFVDLKYERPTDHQVASWQYIERTTRKGAVDGVNVFAVRKKAGREPEVLLVKQYRPPVGKYTIELPAGLVDPGESLEVAALRELKEETGYTAQLVGKATYPQYLSPGLTNECLVTVFADIDCDAPENANPTQSEEDRRLGVETFWLPVKDLAASLEDYASKGLGIFGGLSAIAQGLALKQRLNL